VSVMESARDLPDLGPRDPFAEFPASLDAHRAGWLRAYAHRLVVLDALILVAASLVGAFARFGAGQSEHVLLGMSYVLAGLLLVPIWLAVLALSRCYETRFLGTGTEEFKRVANASFRVVACVTFLLFMTKTDVSRGFVAWALPAGLIGIVGGRYAARGWLHRQRRRGQCMHKVVVVGPAAAALEMTTTLQRAPMSGLTVVGACVVDSAARFTSNSLVPVLGSLSEVLPVLEELGADTVVVAKGTGITADDLRQLTYDLAGTGVDLLVSPLLTTVAGPRISMRPMPGLALIHVDEPELDGVRRLVKELFDRVVALAGVALILPLLAVVAVAVKVSSPGPVFFVQERIGKDGQPFHIWKFRTMYADAEARKADLLHLSKSTVFFKVQDDPRITSVGRILRKYSLDELPQLFNVVIGHMSLVGPRPQLQSEVDSYDTHLTRRLLVKPGITGLWQVSGRNDLGLEEATSLDLHYVENWSLGLDIAVLARTVIAVLRPSGAY
jgi:exopolysaccharide biosynthesis polyprenyl glycosylphosphotransferase